MNTKDLVDIIHTLETTQNEIDKYSAMINLGYIDDMENNIYMRSTGEPFDYAFIPRNCYTKEEIELINTWVQELGEDNFDQSPFSERTFLRNFLNAIPQEEQMNYIRNTNMYYGKNKLLADKNFVLVTRRALPSIEDKPEAFWSDDSSTTYWGLRNEQRGAQRGYSVILVSTLGDIERHGVRDFELLSEGVSDGEIITSIKPFPRDKILFAFKPLDEVKNFFETIKTADKTYDEFLTEIKTIAAQAYNQQSYIPSSNNENIDDACFELTGWD